MKLYDEELMGLTLFNVLIGIGFGSTYTMQFWAEDEEHAREQAHDALVNLDEEWVERIEVAPL